ncbi:hypothetical protein F5Y05DRAFT_390008 [Hypoxylon sp. FL0543]|nr:hypothetical protein F5Y05DRAFT_390008 [Hypoxylon sp. FL0543]
MHSWLTCHIVRYLTLPTYFRYRRFPFIRFPISNLSPSCPNMVACNRSSRCYLSPRPISYQCRYVGGRGSSSEELDCLFMLPRNGSSQSHSRNTYYSRFHSHMGFTNLLPTTPIALARSGLFVAQTSEFSAAPSGEPGTNRPPSPKLKLGITLKHRTAPRVPAGSGHRAVLVFTNPSPALGPSCRGAYRKEQLYPLRSLSYSRRR